jgi:hypothetical protein
MQRRRMLGVLLGALVVGALGGGGRAEAQHPIVDVSGEWNSVFAGGTSTLRLTQYGATVVGVYGSSPSMPGAMSGRINGRVVIGRWTDAASSVGASGWSSRRTRGASSAPLGGGAHGGLEHLRRPLDRQPLSRSEVLGVG